MTARTRQGPGVAAPVLAQNAALNDTVTGHGTPIDESIQGQATWARTTRRRSLQLELRDTWVRTSTGRAA